MVSRSWPSQAREFGAPRWSIRPLPIVELGLGVSLAVTQTRWIAWALIALLAAFTMRQVTHLRAGRRPRCACFGNVTSRPLSWWSVARNLGLIGIGLLAALS